MSELPKFYTLENPKARNEYKCCECRGVIQKGEKYQNYSGYWSDSGFHTFKTCSDCVKLRDDLATAIDKGCWPAFGELTSDCAETGDEWLDLMVSIKMKRGGKIMDWMTERLNKSKESSS